MELLHEAVPEAAQHYPAPEPGASEGMPLSLKDLQVAARALGLQLRSLHASTGTTSICALRLGPNCGRRALVIGSRLVLISVGAINSRRSPSQLFDPYDLPIP